MFMNYHFNQNRHSGESRNPGFPVKTGTQSLRWFPIFVGRRLDAPVSSTGQAPQVRHDGKDCLWTNSKY